MQRKMIRLIFSWGALLSMLCCLYYYAGTVEVRLDTPQLLSATYENETVALHWSSAQYATSYRIYCRRPGGGWSLLEAVPATTLSYSVPCGRTEKVEYAVRACNVSGSYTALSDYSEPAQIQKNGEVSK